jgi:PKD repeat protein
VGSQITFTNTTPNAGASTFQLFVDNTLTTENTFTFNTPGVRRFRLRRVGDNNVCLNEYEQEITISALPVPDFTFTPGGTEPVCSNTAIQFTNTSTPTSGLTYRWNFNDGSPIVTAKDPSHVFRAFGATDRDIDVTLSVTGPGNCEQSVTKRVRLRGRPNPRLRDSFGDITEFRNCGASPFNDFEIQVSDNTSEPGDRFVINWGDGSPEQAFTSRPNNLTKKYTQQGVFIITYTVTGTNGCVGTSTFRVFNISNPAIGVSTDGSSSGCAPLTLTFRIENFLNNDPSTVYEIAPGDDTEAVRFNHPPPATYTHTYTASSCERTGRQFVFTVRASNGCETSTATVSPVLVYTPPTAGFDVESLLCVGQPFVPVNSSIEGSDNNCSRATSYTWDFGDGTVVNTTSLTQPLNHVYRAAGQYTITLTAANRSCGASTSSKTVEVVDPAVSIFTGGTDNSIRSVAPNEPPIPDLLPANDGCLPVTLPLQNLSEGFISEVRWSVIEGPRTGFLFATSDTTSTSNNETLRFTEAGIYLIRLTVSSGCNESFSVARVVIKDRPTLTAAAIKGFDDQYTTDGTRKVACSPATLNLFTDALTGDNNALITDYTWEITGTNGTANPPPLTAANTRDPGEITLQTGSYQVRLTVSNECGEITVVQEVLIVDPPEALISLESDALCENETLTLQANTGSGLTYQWFRNGQPVANSTAATLQVTEGGSYIQLQSARAVAASPQSLSPLQKNPPRRSA